MLESLAKLFGLQSHSKRCRPMIQDPLLQLIDSPLTFDTQTFLGHIGNLAFLSPDPQVILNRFMVQGLTHCRDAVVPWSMIPQRELLILDLADTLHPGSDPLIIVLERTASPNDQPSPMHFIEHPDSTTVLKSIAQTLKDMGSASKSRSRESSLFESLRSSDPLSPYQAVTTDEFEHIPSSPSHPSSDLHSPYQSVTTDGSGPTPPGPLPSPSSRLSLLDSASLAATRAAFISTQSTSKVCEADDRFIGSKNLGPYLTSALNKRQIRPRSLSLFHLAVLADVVHNHASLYSILKQQCFWFLRIICDVVRREYVCTSVPSQADFISNDDIFIPQNNYLPDLEGRWMGIMINRVEEVVTSAMVTNFRKYHQEKEDKVHFSIYPDSQIPKSCR